MRTAELMNDDGPGIQAAQQMGLVTRTNGYGRGVPAIWQLTPLGIDWCEGRVTVEYQFRAGYRWAATWLRALPKGLRLAA